jgi:hypothetical protein
MADDGERRVEDVWWSAEGGWRRGLSIVEGGWRMV